MFEILRYGEMLLSMLTVAGDWLLSTPGDFHFVLPEYAIDVSFPNPFGSVASMLFGGGIIVVLGFRLVKFILDVVF